ncbi:hypothetical protein HY642_03895 [Candidatus Woesearchaeota archaeon]|nr:hypothetical protein [Candidatus Woesearchaeota archaeon]
MAFEYSPIWLHGVGFLTQFFGAIVAALIGVTGYRAYQLTKDTSLRAMSYAFILITAAFGVSALTDLLISYKIVTAMTPANNAAIASAFSLGQFAYVFLYFSAFLLLLCAAYKLQFPGNLPTIAVLSAIGSFFLSHNFLAVRWILIASLVLLVAHFFRNYWRNRKAAALLAGLSFLLLLVSQSVLLFVIGARELFLLHHALNLLAFTMLLAVILRVLKHG